MARRIIFTHHPLTISYIGFGVGAFILCAFALFMCASHSRRKSWRKWKACYGHGYYNHDPVIQHNQEEILSNPFGADPDPSTYSSDQGSVWKKNILMGGKCQLPNFSGVIIYDSTGTVVPHAKTPQTLPALTWK